MSESGFERIARDLARGEISRRSALKRLAAGGLGLGAASLPTGVAQAMGGCPPGRKKCNGKCCPEKARCVDGKCRCKRGFKKCGRKCVDLDTSVKHCGVCGNRCEPGEACIGGDCTPLTACAGNGECAANEFCAAPAGNCSGPGTCQPRAEVCTAEYEPVCGCDGQTYGNACEAEAAGVRVASTGVC